MLRTGARQIFKSFLWPVNLKFIDAVKVQRVTISAVLLTHTLGARRGWVVYATTGVIYSRERRSVPNVQTAGWTSGSVWAGTKNMAPPRGFEPRSSNPKRVGTRPPVSVNELFNETLILARRKYFCTWFWKVWGQSSFLSGCFLCY